MLTSNGINGTVYSIALDGSSNLYAGGTFSSAGSTSVHNLAKWNGSAWSDIGGGVATNNPNYYTCAIYSLAFISSTLYVGGEFDTYDAVSNSSQNCNCIVTWSGSAWSTLGSYPDDGVRSGSPEYQSGKVNALYADGSVLYIGGSFQAAGSNSYLSMQDLIKWTGSAFEEFDYINPSPSFYTVTSIRKVGDLLYLTAEGGSGKVTIIDMTDPYSLTSSIPGGSNAFPSAVRCLTADASNNIFVGGDFTSAAGVSAARIAKWNGSVWTGFDPPSLNGNIWCSIKDSAGNIYIGGEFTKINGSTFNKIAKWNGTSWSALGTGITSGDKVISMAFDPSGNLVVVGNFSQVNGSTANNIAKWDGSTWSTYGTGANGEVGCVAFIGSNMYIGGYFSQAGGQAASRLAKWNGSAWTGIGSLGGPVFAMAVIGSTLYLGGQFSPYIQKCVADTLSNVGNGVSSTVYSLATDGSNLYVGGQFSNIDSIPNTGGLAKWNGTAWSSIGSVGGTAGSLLAKSSSEIYLSYNQDIKLSNGSSLSTLTSGGLIDSTPVRTLLDITPTIPTEVTGVVTVENTGGTITLTQDMIVTSGGELTLDVATISDLVGTGTINVQAGGKIKLTGGQQITVLPDTLYALTV
jgi:prepilin-type processing-associated H-X9-DG protein